MSPVNSPHERPVKRGCVFASLPEYTVEQTIEYSVI